MKEDMKAEQATVQRLVEEVLQESQRARNNDLWLLLQYWQKKQYIKVFIPFEKIGEMTAAESITRARRKIQNTEGKLLPTDPQVLIKRKIKEEALKEYYSDNQTLLQQYINLKYGI